MAATQLTNQMLTGRVLQLRLKADFIVLRSLQIDMLNFCFNFHLELTPQHRPAFLVCNIEKQNGFRVTPDCTRPCAVNRNLFMKRVSSQESRGVRLASSGTCVQGVPLL